MALFPPLAYPPEIVKNELLPIRNDFSVAVYNCQNAFAVGAIIRVAHSFLAREILIIGNAPYYEKASMGMEHYETIVSFSNEDAFLRHVEGRPVWAVEKDHARRSLNAVAQFPKEVVFVFGSERAGLPSSIVGRADEVIGIPMYGVNHSFPVTVAAGIVMHEWARGRYANGAVV